MFPSRHALGVLVALVALMVAGCSSGSGSSQKHMLTGNVAVNSVVMNAADMANGGHGKKGDSCTVEPGTGYDDITWGATVVVKDETGSLIATGRLGIGGLGGDLESRAGQNVLRMHVPLLCRWGTQGIYLHGHNLSPCSPDLLVRRLPERELGHRSEPGRGPGQPLGTRLNRCP